MGRIDHYVVLFPPQNLYCEKMGKDKIELVKESKTIDPSTLDPAKVCIYSTLYLVYIHVYGVVLC